VFNPAYPLLPVIITAGKTRGLPDWRTLQCTILYVGVQKIVGDNLKVVWD
jgi:hypothetical protein